MHKALSLVPEPQDLLGGAALYSQHLWEVEALGSEVQRHLLLHSELGVSLGMKICLYRHIPENGWSKAHIRIILD